MELLLFIFGFIAFAYLQSRLNRIESMLRTIHTPVTEEERVIAGEGKKEKVVQAVPTPREEIPVPEPPKEYVPPTPDIPELPPSVPLLRKPISELTADREFEFKFGSRILTAVGIIAVAIGIAFFLRYAF